MFTASGYNWSSSNVSIAQITYSGTATAMDGGTSFLTGHFDNVIWQSGILGCHSQNETVYGSAEMNVLAGDVTFKTVTSSNNSETANFTRTFGNNFNADLNLGGGTVNVCSGAPQGFDITINFDLPYRASSIFHPDARTSVSESDEQQFQHLGFRFEDVVFTPNGRGKMIIRMRRVAEERTDKTIRVKISGGLQQGGAYTGEAKIKFVCP